MPENTSLWPENKVFVRKKVVYIYNLVQVIREILFIRKNKGL